MLEDGCVAGVAEGSWRGRARPRDGWLACDDEVYCHNWITIDRHSSIIFYDGIFFVMWKNEVVVEITKLF